jgi:Ca2+-binding RTX toxin-like protein
MLNNQYLQLVQRQLAHFAAQDNFKTAMATAFGNHFNQPQLNLLRQQWLSGNFSVVPDIQVLTQGELGTANGGYAAGLDKIFISSDFLAHASGEAIAALVLEEVGHRIDRLLNGNRDSAGDEGEIFGRLVRGEVLSPDILAGLKAQNDQAVITVGGKQIAIEQQNLFGTVYNDTITGSTLADYVLGYQGNDVIYGNGGDDTLKGGNDNDAVNGGDGNDTLYGDNGNDSLYGDSGDDNFYGGDGDDVINAGTSNLVTDSNFNEALYGDAGNDWLTGGNGNDYLDGGLGIDSLYAGSGDDFLDGGSDRDLLSGEAGNDEIYGGDGSDSIYGGLGADTMIGGTSSDVYVVDNIGDVVIENLNEGRDTVVSTISYILGNNVETLYLSATVGLSGTGNTLNNLILGSSGNDLLNGKGGNDTLRGGIGADKFCFTGVALTGVNTVAAVLGRDTIADFAVGVDKIALSKSAFAAVTSAVNTSIGANFIQVANDALVGTQSAAIVYSQTSGNLFYNQNGAVAGYGTGGNFAVLTGLPNLTASDFNIVA